MNTAINLLEPFVDIVHDSQKNYRQLLKAMSEPGTVFSLDEELIKVLPQDIQTSLFQTTWAVMQTVLDSDCRVFLSPLLKELIVTQSLSFYTDCEITEDIAGADFVFIDISEIDLVEDCHVGTLEEPHKSATVVVQTSLINSDITETSSQSYLKLSGPGIESYRLLNIENLSNDGVQIIKNNHQCYPCGLDFVFCSPVHTCALPRTTVVEEIS
jgi:alpha-D-ribose 1-methylphosphonate 5-triphosphate synthase subunit PhnH